MQRFACAPYAAPNDADRAMRSETTSAETLSRSRPPYCLGNVDAEQSKLAGTSDEVARERPVFRLELIDLRQHLAVDELLDRLRHQPMLFRQLFGREHRCGSVSSSSHEPPFRTFAATAIQSPWAA